MRAAVIHEHGEPDVLRIEQVATPVVGPHDVLVRQTMTTVNHRDIWIRKGHASAGYRIDLPAVLGIDICGEVIEVGSEVDTPSVGDRVTINPYMPCGRCTECVRGRVQYCNDFNVYHGAYAEYALVPAHLTIPVPAELSDTEVACFPNSYTTAWEMLIGKAQIGPDDTVFIWAGTSGLGCAGIDIARLAGARVITSAGSQSKRDLLAARGLDVVDHYSPDMVRQVRELTDGRGVSVVFEHIGTATWNRSLEMCRPGGTVVTAGATSGDKVTMDVTELFVKQIRILSSRVANMGAALAAARQLSLGRFKPLVGVVMPLEEIAEAHRRVEASEVAGKVLVTFD